MRRWDSVSGKRGVARRNEDRLEAALAMGARARERAWCGSIILLGPIVGNKTTSVNLYLEPGSSRYDTIAQDGRRARMSNAQIIRRIKSRLQRLRVPAE
jgi:hypothetical protein